MKLRLLAALATILLSASATADPGGWIVAGPPTPEELAALLSPPAPSRDGGSVSTNVLPLRLPADPMPHVRELARGLDGDWEACFRFVRDNVAFSPYRGFLRGAERTLLDRAGNDADQALLLLELLRASGRDDARLMYLPLATDSEGGVESGVLIPFRNFDGDHPLNFAGMIGEAADADTNGIPARVGLHYLTAAVGYAWRWVWNEEAWEWNLYAAVEHFWVRLPMPDGSSVDLDPSFKPMRPAKRRNVLSDSGMDLPALLAAAGGTTNAVSASGFTPAVLGGYLDDRCASLRSALGGGSVSLSESLEPPRTDPAVHDLPFFPVSILGAPIDFGSMADSARDVFRVPAELEIGTAGTISFFLDELGGRGFSVRFDGDSGGATTATVLLGGETVAAEPAASSAKRRTCRIFVDHPRLAYASTTSLPAVSGTDIAAVLGFGPESGTGAADAAVAEARSVSSPDGRAERIAASRAIGMQWHVQRTLSERMWKLVTGSGDREAFMFGFSGQAETPFLDIPSGLFLTTGALDRIAGPTVLSSALEHAVLEEHLLGSPAGAVSTIRVLSLAAASGTPVFFADPDNLPTVLSSLSDYGDEYANEVSNRVAAGGAALLPSSGAVGQGSWHGAGYEILATPASGPSESIMRIAGGLSGGYVDVHFDIPAYHSIVNSPLLDGDPNAGVSGFVFADPVSFPSGALLDAADDLALPGLVWSRTYDSRGRFSDGPLGRGWSHAFEASVAETTDVDAAFGGGSVAAAAPTLVACAALDELIGPAGALPAGETARRWTAAALVADWWTRRFVGGTVAVRLGPQTLRFAKLEDGTFAPAPGVTASLSRTNGCYALEARLGPTWRFDEAGRLASVEDRSGNATTLSRDTAGRLVRVANGFGFSFDLAWDGDRVSSVSDSAGRSVRYAFDATGLLTNVIDAAGASWRLDYDAEGNLAAKTDPLGATLLLNAFDAFGRVTNQVDAAGCARSFGYADGAAVRTLDSAGGRTVSAFSPKGVLLARTDETGASAAFVPDSAGRVAESTNALGFATLLRRDARGDLVSAVESANGLPRETSFARDGRGRIVATTNALGFAAESDWDGCDRPVSVRLPDGTSVSNAWTAQGLPASRTIFSAAGAVARRDEWTYGTNGLPVSHRVSGPGLPAAGVEETFAWTAAGLPASRTDPLGGTTSFAYDGAGRLVRTVDAAGATNVLARDAAGRVVSSTDPLGRVTRFSWTPDGRLASVRDPLGGVSTNVWDAFGRLVRAEDARGGVRTFSYDGAGRLVRAADSLGASSFVYDALGRLVETTNALGAVSSFASDPLGRPVLAVDPLGAETTNAWDLLDRPVASVDPLGRVRSAAWDALGRRVLSVRPSGAAESFAWDALGGLVSAVDAEGGVLSVARDAFGRATAATNACGSPVFSAAYDAAGRLSSRTDGNGVTLSFVHDAAGRLLRREGPSSADAFAYDAAGGLLLASNAVIAEAFARDACGRVASATFGFPGGPSLAVSFARDAGGLATNAVLPSGIAVSRAYDADGRPASVSAGPGREWTFAYDAAGRLVSVSSPDGLSDTFAYDAAGRVSAWNAGGFAARAIERDAAGRRVRDAVVAGSVPAPAADRVTDLAFDAARRPVSGSLRLGAAAPLPLAFLHDGNGALTNLLAGGASVLSAAHDDLGRPAAAQGEAFLRDALGAVVATERGGARRLWIPDPDDPLRRPLAECDGTGAPVRTYLWSGARLLGFLDATNGLVVAHCDEQGSVVALSDEGGTLLHAAAYGPFGEDWGSAGENPTPFAWLGSWGVRRIPGAGALGPLHLTAHRLYSPSLRRFLSPDPLGPAGGLNPYAYPGDPLESIDPLGLCAFETILGGMARFSGEAGVFLAKGVDAAVNLMIQTGLQNPNFAAAGIQGQIDANVIQSFGSPFQRMGVYGKGEPPIVFPEEVPQGILLVGGVYASAQAGGRQIGLSDIQSDPMGHAGRTVSGFIAGATVSPRGTSPMTGTVALSDAVSKIQSGRLSQSRDIPQLTKDGLIMDRGIFKNAQHLLPDKPPEYYREFLLMTPSLKKAGTERIIMGRDGEFFYTPDHYKSFIPLNPNP